MLQNYFKVAVRNILKYKFFSFINIFGMTVGIASCLLIILYISHELSYDKFHEDADRIYQAGLHGRMGGQDVHTSNTCPPMAAALLADIPAVESTTRLNDDGAAVIRQGDNVFRESKVFYADSNFFDFFSFRLKEGDARTVLNEPNTAVLTESMAKKYFGDQDPVGGLITIGTKKIAYKVTGIAIDPPTNSHFTFNILLSSESSDRMKQVVWLNNFMYTYFKLKPNTTIDQVTDKFPQMTEKYVGPEIVKFTGTTLQQLKESGGDFGYNAVKITDIHLRPISQDGIEPAGNIMYVYFFAGIGAFIMIIACINFMNLSTARSAGRAKEVGLRKALGSLRAQMVNQFLAESMLYSIVAIVLAIATCYFLLPSFNLISGKQLGMNVFTEPVFIGAIVALVILVGFVSGSYPAFYLTSFSAVEVLKGKMRSGMKSKGIRSFLVVFQFFLSIFLIIFTAEVYQQIQFMQDRSLGIDKNNVLMIPSTQRLGANKEAFRNALAQESSVVKASFTNNYFPGVNNTTVFKSAGSEEDHIMGQYFADYEHQQVMKFEMKEGRYFSREFPSDTMAIVINEAAANEFGFKNPVGEEVIYNDGDGHLKLRIIGVVKDFNFESLKDKVRPISIILSTSWPSNLLVRYTGDPQEFIKKTESLWKQYGSNEPFEYNFLDQQFDQLFRAEQRMGKVFTIFTAIAILIACLGLFALAAFTSEQRTKEIGIRKSMGATVFGLTVLLSKEFTRLVLFAFVPAALLAWYVSYTWLQGFAYRVEISPLVFLASGVSAIMISWLTISYQSIKAASANPVESLRYE
jgi:putative ABC transport system permease protein